MRNRLDLLAPLALVLLAHCVSLGQPLMSEDHSYVAYIERRGSVGALEDTFTERFLGVVDFWRPGEMATHVVAYALGGGDSVRWQAFNLLILGALLVASWAALGALKVRGWQRGLTLLAIGLHPVLVETQGAGVTRASLMADVWQMTATALCLRGNYLSLPCAALGYATKESAFAFGPFIGAFLLAARDDRRSRSFWTLIGAHAVLEVGVFFYRRHVLGDVKAPYGREWGEAIGEGLTTLPDTVQRLIGWGPLAALGIGLLVALAHRRFGVLWAIPAVAAQLIPIVPLPAKTITLDTNARVFVAFSTVVLVTASWMLRSRPRLAIPVLAVVAALNASQLPKTWERFLDQGHDGKAILRAVHDHPADHMLVTEMPVALTWSFPAAARPPFDRTGRCVFAFRGGTDTNRLGPLRPLDDDITLAVARGDELLVAPGRMKPYEPWTPEGVRRGERWAMNDLPIPGERLAVLLVQPDEGVARGTVTLRVVLPDGRSRFHTLRWAGTPLVRVPLCDVPELPLGTVDRLFVTGGHALRVEAPFPGDLRVAAPGHGVAIDEAWLARPFEFESVPPATAGFRTTVLTALGSLSVVTKGKTLSLVAMEAAQPTTLLHLANALPHGSQVFFTIEALADPENPGSILDRCPTFLVETAIPIPE